VVKNKNYYDIKIVHRNKVEIWILIQISLHKTVGRVGADLHFERVYNVIHSRCCCYYLHQGGYVFVDVS